MQRGHSPIENGYIHLSVVRPVSQPSNKLILSLIGPVPRALKRSLLGFSLFLAVDSKIPSKLLQSIWLRAVGFRGLAQQPDVRLSMQ